MSLISCPGTWSNSGGRHRSKAIRRIGQKKLVKTDNTLAKNELAEYLEHPTPQGPGESRMGRPDGRGYCATPAPKARPRPPWINYSSSRSGGSQTWRTS